MLHNRESARATVLTPEDESQRKPLHNPINSAGRRRYWRPGSSSACCSPGGNEMTLLRPITIFVTSHAALVLAVVALYPN
jgi:DUF1680 family protein